MRVLIVENDPLTARTLELLFRGDDFNVYTTDLGEEGLDLGRIYDYDLIVLQTHLVDMSGLDVLRKLRASKVHTPVILLSPVHETEFKLQGFAAGADDYVTMPFHKQELLARASAVIRRSKGHAQSLIETGNLVVNFDAGVATVDGRPLHLTGKESKMLELLSLRKGMTITKEMFLNHLYGGRDEPEAKIVDVFICKIRKKLRDCGCSVRIETIWGKGYLLRDPPDLAKAA